MKRYLASLPKRSHVRYVDTSRTRWFPGHMRKGMTDIHSQMAAVDVIIEVHDARIPFSGRTSFIQKFAQVRPHILLLNKADLAEQHHDLRAFRTQLFENATLSNHHLRAVYLTQLNTPEKQKQLLRKLLRSLPRLSDEETPLTLLKGEFTDDENQATVSEDTSGGIQRIKTIKTMAVGIPNSGKSTLINALRSIGRGGPGGAVRVGRLAGQTRSVGYPVVISRDAGDSLGSSTSRIVMVDTPGILEPRVQSLPEQLSLAVCGALDYGSLDLGILVDYLLFWWNLRQRSEYVSVLGLPGPTDNVAELLARVCARQSFFIQGKVTSKGLHVPHWQPYELEEIGELTSPGKNTPLPDMLRAAQHVLRLFNTGAFGRSTFLPADEEAAKPFFVPLSKS